MKGYKFENVTMNLGTGSQDVSLIAKGEDAHFAFLACSAIMSMAEHAGEDPMKFAAELNHKFGDTPET